MSTAIVVVGGRVAWTLTLPPSCTFRFATDAFNLNKYMKLAYKLKLLIT